MAALAALAVLGAACSPAGHRHVRAPDPQPQALATPLAGAAARYFGDEYAERERALQSRPAEPAIDTF